MRILLAEDDPMLGDILSRTLAQQAHAIDWVRSGPEAAEHWRTTPCDLVLLDLGLPGRDGLDVLREARAAGQDCAVIILTARDAIADRISGLDAGADDYLLKPIDPKELLARVRAVCRRRGGRAQAVIEYLGLRLNLAERDGQMGDRKIEFTRREFALLSALLEQPGRVWTREQLVDRMYSWDQSIASNALEVQVHALRRKLGNHYISTVRGVGYRVANEDSPS